MDGPGEGNTVDMVLASINKNKMGYLCGVRINRTRRYESGSVSTELGGTATSPPALVYCYSDILAFHFDAMHGLLANACIFFTPKLHDSGITSKSCLRAN